LIKVTAKLHGGDQELTVLLREILAQVADIVGATSAVLGRTESDGVFKPLCRIGAGEQTDASASALSRLASIKDGDLRSGITLLGDLALMRLEAFQIVAQLQNASALNTEKIYLLRLFLASAGQVLANARLQKMVLQSEKLSALGSALGSIVHDLRNPVGAIQSLCELIHQALADGSTGEVAELVELVRQSCDDAMDIVNSVLDFTRKSPLERSPVLLADFGSRLREKSRHFLEGGCTLLEINVPPNVVVWIDARKLQRALLNLIKNACEVLSSKEVKAPRITVTMAEAKGQLQIEVADNGPGIPPEIRLRLFEPFVTHGKSYGTGLGLAIVRQIVESHDGTLTVESSPAGAAFKMRLPQPEAADGGRERISGTAERRVGEPGNRG